jgi:DNA polymerase III delta subunit
VKLPPALLVCGSDAHRRRVFLREFTTRCVSEGWSLNPLDGADRNGLVSLLSTVGVLFPTPTVAVITRPEKVSPDDVRDHLQSPEPSLCLLFVSESDKPSGGVLDGFPQAQIKSFSLPPFYKLDEHAAEFSIALAKSRGVNLPDRLARALVRAVGNDLGVLSYEVDKVSRLASALGDSDIAPTHLKGTIAPLTEMDGTTLVEALGTRSRKALSDELSRYKASKKGDPTVELCGRTLTPSVFRWLQAATLHAKGISVASAAGRVGSSPWYWEHKVLPPAKVWGIDGCRELLESVARAQTAVFSGFVSPWGLLESSLLKLSR